MISVSMKYPSDLMVIFSKACRLKSLKEQSISLVVTDLHMPKVDGFALLAHLSENYPDIQVIITICEGHLKWDDVVTNDCGAFIEEVDVPHWVNNGAVSVKAWIDLNGNGSLEEEMGENQASWPLDIH